MAERVKPPPKPNAVQTEQTRSLKAPARAASVLPSERSPQPVVTGTAVNARASNAAQLARSPSASRSNAVVRASAHPNETAAVVLHRGGIREVLSGQPDAARIVHATMPQVVSKFALRETPAQRPVEMTHTIIAGALETAPIIHPASHAPPPAPSPHTAQRETHPAEWLAWQIAITNVAPRPPDTTFIVDSSPTEIDYTVTNFTASEA